MLDLSFIGIILLAIVLFGGAFLISRHLEQRRRAAFTQVAARLGLAYQPNRDRQLPSRFAPIDLFYQGTNRYCSHILVGEFNGSQVMAFEYHYQIESRGDKGAKTTHHYHFSVFTTPLPGACPEVTIRPEGIFSKIAQAVGYDDIDFESAEFSRRYCVRSRNRRFAYDVCHPLAIEFLLRFRDLDVELDGSILAFIQRGTLQHQYVEYNLRRLLAFRRLLPDTLFNPAREPVKPS